MYILQCRKNFVVLCRGCQTENEYRPRSVVKHSRRLAADAFLGFMSHPKFRMGTHDKGHTLWKHEFRSALTFFTRFIEISSVVHDHEYKELTEHNFIAYHLLPQYSNEFTY